MTTNIAARDPMRPVDWRWQRAMDIYEGEGLPTSRSRDEPVGYKWISRAVRFKKAYGDAPTPSVAERVENAFPAIFWAHHIWRGDLNDNNPMCYSVEAHTPGRCQGCRLNSSMASSLRDSA